MTDAPCSQCDAPERVSYGVARAQAWMDAMSLYRAPASNASGEREPVEEAREQYIAGHITVEAFEAKLDLAFGLMR